MNPNYLALRNSRVVSELHWRGDLADS